MARLYFKDRTVDIFIAFIVVVVFVLIVLGVYFNNKAKNECADNGGTINEYNCRVTCTTDVNGYMNCNKTCDWQCVNLPAERP